MNRKNVSLYSMVITAALLAIGMVLPFLTGQLQSIGKLLSPLHIPALICGLCCGWQWGLGLGIILPIMRGLIFGMPPFPVNAVPMAFELAAYGVITGILYPRMIRLFKEKSHLPAIYTSMVIAMMIGRFAGGAAKALFISLGVFGTQDPYTFAAFFSAYFVNTVPGAVIHLIIVPAVVIAVERARLSPLIMSLKNGENKTFCSNPIVRSIYTADPAPMVYGDTLYLYTTHDEDELINDFYTMFDWRCFSTKDMVNWTDHGVIFSLSDISWADSRAWAPQAIERGGKFYLYCPVHKTDGGMAIAVGISDRPEGPYKDLGYPLIDEGDWNDIDPTVFIDDDGQAYLYFGNPELRYVLLNEDMISYDEKTGIVRVPMTEESFAKGSHDTGTSYGEGPWFYKRNGLYYMVYAAFAVGQQNEHLAYSTSKSPTGPWTYGGVLMTEEGGVFTNHPGIADFKGHSFLFYHTGELPGGSLFHRSVCVAEFEYNEDGSIGTIPKCDGVRKV